jgi:hypothetical protein
MRDAKGAAEGEGGAGGGEADVRCGSSMLEVAKVVCRLVSSVQVSGTQFACFTGTKVQILTLRTANSATIAGLRGDAAHNAAASNRYSVYLLCWYKSTHTDACGGTRRTMLPPVTGTQFTCFTGTKVQILTYC